MVYFVTDCEQLHFRCQKFYETNQTKQELKVLGVKCKPEWQSWKGWEETKAITKPN